jgi:hypothetical protein
MLRKLVLLGVILLVISVIGSAAGAFAKLNIPIKQLRAAPTEEAKVVFDIPIDVVLTGVTSDESWYQVKIGFNFLGYHEYLGWTRIK